MNSSNIKRQIKRFLPLVLLFIVIILVLVVSITCTKETSFKIFITVFIISIVSKTILNIVSKSNQIVLSIKDKISTIKVLYELIDLENINTIVAINTKDDELVEKAKKEFPGSKEHKQKDLYSIMLPKANEKKLTKFLKDNEVERIIIHSFTKDKDKTNSLSICIDNKLIIQYSKDLLTKEQISTIKDKISKSK